MELRITALMAAVSLGGRGSPTKIEPTAGLAAKLKINQRLSWL